MDGDLVFPRSGISIENTGSCIVVKKRLKDNPYATVDGIDLNIPKGVRGYGFLFSLGIPVERYRSKGLFNSLLSRMKYDDNHFKIELTNTAMRNGPSIHIEIDHVDVFSYTGDLESPDDEYDGRIEFSKKRREVSLPLFKDVTIEGASDEDVGPSQIIKKFYYYWRGLNLRGNHYRLNGFDFAYGWSEDEPGILNLIYMNPADYDVERHTIRVEVNRKYEKKEIIKSLKDSMGCLLIEDSNDFDRSLADNLQLNDPRESDETRESDGA
jgi:hypothetical protein